MGCGNFLPLVQMQSVFPSPQITQLAKNTTSQWQQVLTTNWVNDAGGLPVTLWTHRGPASCLSVTRIWFSSLIVGRPGWRQTLELSYDKRTVLTLYWGMSTFSDFCIQIKFQEKNTLTEEMLRYTIYLLTYTTIID